MSVVWPADSDETLETRKMNRTTKAYKNLQNPWVATLWPIELHKADVHIIQLAKLLRNCRLVVGSVVVNTRRFCDG